MQWQTHIVTDPAIRGGKPTLAGTGVTVTDVLEYLASGMSEHEILEDFPCLTAEHLGAALAFAAERARRLSAPAA